MAEHIEYQGNFSGSQIDTLLAKIQSSQVFTTEEKNKLTSLVNYDDTEVKEDISDIETSLNSHKSNTTNPHQVTKAQVGLGNVDNTSDANKPISTATQAALDEKVEKVTGKGLSTNDFTNEDKEQITTNKNNIYSNTANGGGINMATINNGTGSETLIIPCDPITGKVVVKLAEFTSTDMDVSTSYAQFIYTDDTLSGGLEIGRGTNLRASAVLSKTVKAIKLFAADTTAHSAGDTFAFTNLELCSLDDSSLPYQPYAWDNARITAWILSQA